LGDILGETKAMKKLALLALMLSSAATVAPAAERTTANPDEVVCRTEGVIGSRLGRTRHCATRAEWVQLLRTEREAMRNAQRQGVQPRCMNPGERAAIAGRYYALPSGCE
jgi:hypothetical protein